MQGGRRRLGVVLTEKRINGRPILFDHVEESEEGSELLRGRKC